VCDLNTNEGAKDVRVRRLEGCRALNVASSRQALSSSQLRCSSSSSSYLSAECWLMTGASRVYAWAQPDCEVPPSNYKPSVVVHQFIGNVQHCAPKIPSCKLDMRSWREIFYDLAANVASGLLSGGGRSVIGHADALRL
jgi:hypothetical protein